MMNRRFYVRRRIRLALKDGPSRPRTNRIGLIVDSHSKRVRSGVSRVMLSSKTPVMAVIQLFLSVTSDRRVVVCFLPIGFSVCDICSLASDQRAVLTPTAMAISNTTIMARARITNCTFSLVESRVRPFDFCIPLSFMLSPACGYLLIDRRA